MDMTAISANLRRVRTGLKLSQGDVAEQCGLSREGYRRIEDGAVEPRVESLVRIAAALGVRAEDLVAPVRQMRAVRFRAQKRMTSREDLLADVARWLDNYVELESLLGEHAPYRLRDLARELQSKKVRDPRWAAAECRRALGIRQDELIRDICGLVEDHGIKMFTPSLASEGFFGLSVGEGDGGPAIVVNRWERISVERWIFTAAHELGHLLFHFDAYDVTRSEENNEEESEADRFASYFLMPDEAFDKEWNEARGLGLVDRVFKLKRIFRVSWKTVVYRIAARSSDPGSVWKQFYTAHKRKTGRALRGIEEPDALGPEAFYGPAPTSRAADEPEHLLPHDFLEDRLRRLVRAAVEKEEISLGRAAEILELDLKEMRALSSSWME